MKNLKAHQKTELIREYGILMAPLVELARAGTLPSANEIRIAIAKVQAGKAAWAKKAMEFSTLAPDIILQSVGSKISAVPNQCCSQIGGISVVVTGDSLKGTISNLIANADEQFSRLIEDVPIEWEPVVFEANTPFTSYLRIKETIVTVKVRLHYFDRYLKPDFFELFLASVEKTIPIRLVTTAKGVRDVAAVSNLARKEFADFQLIEVNPIDLHDRNLRVDDLIFSLGPGVDRAGIALTNFGPCDSSAEAHKEFDRIIEKGRVVS